MSPVTLSAVHFRGSDTILIIVIVALLVCAAVLALAETGLVRMTKAKALTLQEEGKRGSGRLLSLIEHPEKFLNPVLLLVLICQLVAATLAGVVSAHLFGALGVTIAAIFEVVIIFVFAEAVPKNWAVRHPDRAALFAAPFVSRVLRFPPVRLLSAMLIGLSNLILPGGGRGGSLTESELLAMADVAVEEAVIETDERRFIRSIIEFGDTVVREVMLPRPDMLAAHGEDPVGEVLDRAIAAGHSRIPVYGENVDDVIGLIFGKDLMRAALDGHAGSPIANLVREAHFVPETKRVAELLREMQTEKFHMAIVVDEYGGTAGLVTLEDLVEELVGEIVDEDDLEQPQAQPLPNGEFLVSARMAVDEVNELLHARLPEGDWDTVGGLLLSLLGHLPEVGESAEADGCRLTAERVHSRRVEQVRIAKLEPPPEEAAEAEDGRRDHTDRSGAEDQRPEAPSRPEARPKPSDDGGGASGESGPRPARSSESA